MPAPGTRLYTRGVLPCWRTNERRAKKRERGREKLVHQLPPLPLPPPSLEDLNYFNSSEIAVLTARGGGGSAQAGGLPIAPGYRRGKSGR